MPNVPPRKNGSLVAVEMADESSSLKPLFSNYVLLTRVQAEHGDDVTLTFMHIYPRPALPGTPTPMRGEPVARVQMTYEVATKVRDLFVKQLGMSHNQLDAVVGKLSERKSRARRKSK